MAEIIFFWAWPPTFGTKSGRWSTKKKRFRPCLELLAQSLETQSVDEAIFFAFNLLLLVPKIGG